MRGEQRLHARHGRACLGHPRQADRSPPLRPCVDGRTGPAMTGTFLRGAQRRSNLLPDECKSARQAGDCFGAARLAMTGCSMTGCSGDSTHSENALVIKATFRQIRQRQLAPTLQFLLQDCRIRDRQPAHIAPAQISGRCAADRPFAVRRVPGGNASGCGARNTTTAGSGARNAAASKACARGSAGSPAITTVAASSSRSAADKHAGHAGDALDVGEGAQRRLGPRAPRRVAGQVE